MKKLKNEIDNFKRMAFDEFQRKNFNNEMVDKTWKYQKKFGFETSPRKGHEFWNNEADAFKHAFGSAKMSLNMGTWGSLAGGVYHESQTPNNPPGEWNMDSWNNDQGRKIVKDIYKEYGDKFNSFSQDRKEAIIAAKVMMKMKNGELITNPSDKRQYKGFLENIFKGKPTGFAASTEQIIPQQVSYTPEQIGKMSREEFDKNESAIMHQLQTGGFNQEPSRDFGGYRNSHTGDNRIYTAEDIGNFSSSEFSHHEPAINAQMNSIGIPTNNDLHNSGGTVYVEPYTRSDGVEVRGHYRSK